LCGAGVVDRLRQVVEEGGHDRGRARGFNAVMHLRNRMVAPPFIMYYLTFLVPEMVTLLRQYGFVVAVHQNVFEGFSQYLQLVIVTLAGCAPNTNALTMSH
jgi:hypothetical protein